jgi:hypothetical protein
MSFSTTIVVPKPSSYFIICAAALNIFSAISNMFELLSQFATLTYRRQLLNFTLLCEEAAKQPSSRTQASLNSSATKQLETRPGVSQKSFAKNFQRRIYKGKTKK